MNDVLNAYLLQHKSINIPEVGSIYIQNKAAITDFVNKQLFPASYSYRFDRYYDIPEPGFYEYIAMKKGVSEQEAIEWYNNYAADIRLRIKNDGYYSWEGIGVFKNDSSGDLIFEEHQKLLPVLAPVPAKRIIRKDARHAILVGDKEKTNVQMSEILHEPVEVQQPVVRRDRWWIYALVIFLVAVIMILFYYYNNGWQWGTGNSGRIDLEGGR
jgi:hypothetical protein